MLMAIFFVSPSQGDLKPHVPDRFGRVGKNSVGAYQQVGEILVLPFCYATTPFSAGLGNRVIRVPFVRSGRKLVSDASSPFSVSRRCLIH